MSEQATGSGGDSLGELERTLLGGERRYTRTEVAEQAGMSPDRTRRLWIAMGFPAAADDDRVFTEGDVVAARLLRELIDTGAMDQDSELAMARTLGQSLSRLAEWQARDVGKHIESLTDDPEEGVRVTLDVLPVVERLMSYVWRRHVAAAAGRVIGTADERDSQVKTVGFADIVGYTTTSRQLGSGELSELLDRFEQDASEVVATHRGQVVKKVGDEVMFTADDPADAATIALALCAKDRTERGLPQLRAGLATGAVLSRYGDVYGQVVNLAARLTSAAHPSSVLADAELAARLGDDPRFSLRALRPISVRGYRHLRPWVLRENKTR